MNGSSNGVVSSRRRLRATRALVIMVAVVMITTSCQQVRNGNRCRTTNLAHDGGAWIMKCEKGRWRRAITKADAAWAIKAFLDAQTTTTTAAPPATEPPATEPPATAAPTSAAPTTVVAPTIPAPDPWLDDLDLTYGTGGSQLLTVSHDSHNAVLFNVFSAGDSLYPVFRGSDRFSIFESWLVAKTGVNGEVDPAFGVDGVATIEPTGLIAVDADGRVVTVKTQGRGYRLSRTTSVGLADSGANNLDLGLDEACAPSEIVPLADGAVVVVASGNGCVPVRVGNGGEVVPLEVPGANPDTPVSWAVAAGPAGTSFVYPLAWSADASLERIAKFTGSGSIDSSWGQDGQVLNPFPGQRTPSLAALTDGSIVAMFGSGISFTVDSETPYRQTRWAMVGGSGVRCVDG